jgi:hypothetical protein
MVVALVALFVAVSGTALGASYVISRNSSQLGPGTVSGSHPLRGKHDNVIDVRGARSRCRVARRRSCSPIGATTTAASTARCLRRRWGRSSIHPSPGPCAQPRRQDGRTRARAGSACRQALGGLPHVSPHLRVAALRGREERQAGTRVARARGPRLHSSDVRAPARRGARRRRFPRRRNRPGQRRVNRTSENSRKRGLASFLGSGSREGNLRRAASVRNRSGTLIIRRSEVRVLPGPSVRSGIEPATPLGILPR